MTVEVIPFLRVSDADRATTWWRRLGFEQESEHQFFEGAPIFRSLRCGSARVFLSEHLGDARPDTLLYLWVDELDPIAAEFGVEPQPAGWDARVRELELVDPDANRVRIGER